MKGHFFYLNNSIDSSVYFSRECIISTTRIATSQSDEPLERRFVNDSCPGVSMTKNPGSFNSSSILPYIF